MPSDSMFVRDNDNNMAIRVVSNTGVSAEPDSVFTRDEDGNVAMRVTSTGGGGGGGGDQHNLGWYATQAALEEAHPTAVAGDWAIVGSTDTVWIWDTDNNEWVDSDQKGQVTSVNNQTGAVTLGINDVAPTQTGKSGYVLGTDGFVAGWVKPEIVQRSAMPQASEDENGKIYQYTGTTDANYTNGYFYKCVSDGATPATYSWTRVDVQPQGDSLPSQTGQSGKFLTTNGTDASWSDTIGQSLYIKSTNLYYAGVVVLKGYNNNNDILQMNMVPNTGMFELEIKNNSNTRTGYYRFDSAISPVQNTYTLGKSTNLWANVYTTKINNGSDITIPTDAGKMAIQVSTMPTAASTNEGQIYQYVGTTDSTYTHGYIYECVSDGATPTPNYSWIRVDTQPQGLTNLATGTSSLSILGQATARPYNVVIGELAKGAASNGSACVAVGVQAYATGNGSTAIGKSSEAIDTECIAIGNGAKAYGIGSVQIKYGTNNTANTVQIGSYTVMSADGTIPTARLTKVNTTITLAAANWSSNTQTVNVTGMTADGVVFPCPIPSDQSDYTSAGILCTAQAAGTLTFTCTSVPTSDIDVTVVML